MSRYRMFAIVSLTAMGLSACGNGNSSEVVVEADESTMASVQATGSAPDVPLAELVGGGECPATQGDIALMPPLMGLDWYEVSAAELVRLVGAGERSFSTDYDKTELLVVKATEVRPLGVRKTPGELAFLPNHARGVAERLALLSDPETVVLGAYHNAPNWLVSTVAVVRDDGEVAFVNVCATERATPRFAAFADFAGQRPRDFLYDIAKGRDVSLLLNQFALDGLRPTPWEDRDPGSRQFDLTETPSVVLEAHDMVRLRIAVPKSWIASEGLVVCTRVAGSLHGGK